MPYFENQRARLYYEKIGKGKTFIFLHGASLDMGQWEREVDHFSSNYQVITLDARGHGRSSLPKGKVSPDVFWQDVVAMMDHDSLTQRQQQYIHKHILDSKLVTIKNAHHGTNLDNPEQVENEIERFLNKD